MERESWFDSLKGGGRGGGGEDRVLELGNWRSRAAGSGEKEQGGEEGERERERCKIIQK